MSLTESGHAATAQAERTLTNQMWDKESGWDNAGHVNNADSSVEVKKKECFLYGSFAIELFLRHFFLVR